MLRTHHLPCHILIVILYVICPTCCKNYYQSLRWHLRQQIFAITTLIDRFTSLRIRRIVVIKGTNL